MRVLTQNEMCAISGGMYCTDKEGFSKIMWSAAKDGASVAMILAPISGMALYVASTYFAATGTSALIGLGATLLSAPVYAVGGAYYSSAWNILN